MLRRTFVFGLNKSNICQKKYSRTMVVSYHVWFMRVMRYATRGVNGRNDLRSVHIGDVFSCKIREDCCMNETNDATADATRWWVFAPKKQKVWAVYEQLIHRNLIASRIAEELALNRSTVSRPRPRLRP